MYRKPPCPYQVGQPIAWEVSGRDLLFWKALGAPLRQHDGRQFVLLQADSGDVFGADDGNARDWKYGQFVRAGSRRFFLKYISDKQIRMDLQENRPNYAEQEATFWAYSPRLCRTYGYQLISRYRTDAVCGEADAQSEVYHAVLLECMQGMPAPDWMGRYFPQGAPPEVLLDLTRALLCAMADYGAGANAPRHLDIRPHNIMLDGAVRPALRLFDYDWSHTGRGRGHTLRLLQNHCIEGNEGYLIPLGDNPISCRCDLYQFALTVCFFLTGQHCREQYPASAADPTDPHNYGLPAPLRQKLHGCGLHGLAEILERCLLPLDDAGGYADVRDVLRDVERLPGAQADSDQPVWVRRVSRTGGAEVCELFFLRPWQTYPLTVGVTLCRTAKSSLVGQTLASVCWDPQIQGFRALIWQQDLCAAYPVGEGLQLRFAITPQGERAADSADALTCTFFRQTYQGGMDG